MPRPADIQPELEDTRLRDAEWMRRVQAGDTEAFREEGTRFLQLPIGDVEHVAVADSL